MIGIKDWIMGALLVVILVLGWKAYQGHQEARQARAEVSSLSAQLAVANGSLKAVLEDRDRTRMLSEKRVAISDKQRREAQRKYKELSDALKDNPDWADQPVPDSVWRSLGAPDSYPDGQAVAPGGVAGGLSGSGQAIEPDERGAGGVAERIRGGPSELQH